MNDYEALLVPPWGRRWMGRGLHGGGDARAQRLESKWAFTPKPHVDNNVSLWLNHHLFRLRHKSRYDAVCS